MNLKMGWPFPSTIAPIRFWMARKRIANGLFMDYDFI